MYFYLVVGAQYVSGDSAAAIDNVPLFGTLVASGVELLSAAIVCGNRNNCNGNVAYAVSLGAISVAVCIAIMVTKHDLLQQHG